jgi:hypothetical protein
MARGRVGRFVCVCVWRRGEARRAVVRGTCRIIRWGCGARYMKCGSRCSEANTCFAITHGFCSISLGLSDVDIDMRNTSDKYVE